jgi:predicted nucleic acid-binding protein
MFLADTSVWVDYFRGVDSPHARRLDGALSGREGLCVCGLVVTEILQGIADDAAHARVKRLLRFLPYLPMKRRTYVRAAQMYRALRRRGLRIRNTLDCLIGACAVEHRVAVLTRDRDFRAIAKVSRLRLLP